MKIAYYLSQAGQNNLYCRISEGTERVSFPLGHTISPEDWNPAEKEEVRNEPYYFMLTNLNNYLTTKYLELKNVEPIGVLDKLKTNVKTIVDTSGIENLTLALKEPFSERVPDYTLFLNAFERHTALKKGDYQATYNGEAVDVQTHDGAVYTIDTYEGLTRRLDSFVLNRMYDNIRHITNEAIWSEVFAGINVEKQRLFPILRNEWELYWESQPAYSAESKAESWRSLQVFMAVYEATNECITSAYEINEAVLFPLVVLSLLNIYTPAPFYTNYCHIEFSGEEWEGIVTDNNTDGDSTLYFIKVAEL